MVFLFCRNASWYRPEIGPNTKDPGNERIRLRKKKNWKAELIILKNKKTTGIYIFGFFFEKKPKNG